MPVVPTAVVVIDLTDTGPPPHHVDRCDGCGRVAHEVRSVVVRNRWGPPAQRQAWLCEACIARTGPAAPRGGDLRHFRPEVGTGMVSP